MKEQGAGNVDSSVNSWVLHNDLKKNKKLIVTREIIEDSTKNIKVHLECAHVLDLSFLNAFVDREKNFKGRQGCSKALNGFTKWVVDQQSALPKDIVNVTRLHV